MIGDMEILIIFIMNVLIVVYLHARKPSGIKVTIMQHFVKYAVFFMWYTNLVEMTRWWKYYSHSEYIMRLKIVLNHL